MTFKKTIEAEISQKVKNNKARPKFTGSYKKKHIAAKTCWFHNSNTNY